MNAITWLLKIAATMMIVGTVTVDVLALVFWIGYGVIGESFAKFPLWAILVVACVSFLNFLISSFLYGVSAQVATSRGADKKELPLDDRLSDTIDEGWLSSLWLGKWTLVVVSAVIALTLAIFFNDLKFLIGLHRGMEFNASGQPKDAEKWFRLSLEAAGSDRIEITRFLLAGSLIREQKFAEAETELQLILNTLDEKNEDHQALLVYVYSALSNCYMFQNNLPEAEIWTKKSIQLIEEHPQMLGLRFRLLGPYKQFLIPEPPPLAIAISGLNDIYTLEKKPDLALSTYLRILKVLEKQSDLKESDIIEELERFEGQLRRIPEQSDTPDKPNKSESAQKAAAVAASADLAIRKCNVKNVAQFQADRSTYNRKYSAPAARQSDSAP